uniref:Uncharacterized protein n=1 Tax=Rhizophora mucronata TaxID=61149 RepID=A0A2P2KRW6_RHIMU
MLENFSTNFHHPPESLNHVSTKIHCSLTHSIYLFIARMDSTKIKSNPIEKLPSRLVKSVDQNAISKTLSKNNW